ncbi:MAG: tRNA (guanine-N7)-methyltransferase [Leptospiraceae bacterium]|nr:tRNA (guanine-N7)-methyltransferase [Leptospiraceae bacterium]
MSRRNPEIEQRLWQQVTRRRPWHTEPEILVPTECTPFKESILFAEPTNFRVLELGSGWGEYAGAYLKDHPDHNYIAFEIKVDRILNTLRLVRRSGAHALRMIPVNLNWYFEQILPPAAFDLVIVNFPDPWPKRRHWKHRLIQSPFPDALGSLLRPGACLQVATDYGPYARRMLSIFRQHPRFKSLVQDPDYRRERFASAYSTKFERIQRAAGKRPYYMSWQYHP